MDYRIGDRVRVVDTGEVGFVTAIKTEKLGLPDEAKSVMIADGFAGCDEEPMRGPWLPLEATAPA